MTANSVIAIIAPICTVILGFLLDKYFKDKAKLLVYYVHVSAHKLRNTTPTIDVFTHSIVIINTGRITAKNVRISHQNLPDFELTPKVFYQIIDVPNDGKDILIPTIVPNEQITISYIYFPPITYKEVNNYLNGHLAVRHDDGFGKQVNVMPTIIIKTWQKIVLYILLFIGTSTLLYWSGIMIVHFYNYVL